MSADLSLQSASAIPVRPCLIAADVDQTLLSQQQDLIEERRLFLHRIAPQLVEAARLGAQVAFITGNSLTQVCSRLLTWLIQHLRHSGELPLLSQFHFFSNASGVYFHVPAAITRGLDPDSDCLNVLTQTDDRPRRTIRPEFVHAGYLARTEIEPGALETIRRILEQEAAEYLQLLDREAGELSRCYELESWRGPDGWRQPEVDLRSVTYQTAAEPQTATVQVTLRPILSFRQARREFRVDLLGNDVRTRVIERIQAALDRQGLSGYVARPGGRTSIDVTLSRLDKAYALEFLIDLLRVEGDPGRRQKFGSNTIYFGDEVIVGGGNDYCITRIPGVTVIAVNPDKELVPLLSQVYVPSTLLAGPEATAEILTLFNTCARRLAAGQEGDATRGRSVVELFQHELFTTRIQQKLSELIRDPRLPPGGWQSLHSLLTLMGRNDPAARHWFSLVSSELDLLLAQVPTPPVSWS